MTINYIEYTKMVKKQKRKSSAFLFDFCPIQVIIKTEKEKLNFILKKGEKDEKQN